MSDHKLLSITEAAHLLGCTVDGIRRYVLEDGTLAALRVCPRGYKSPFELRGLRLYVVNESGGVIDPSTGAAAGNLRFEQCEVIRHKAKAGVLAKETVPERRTRYLAAFESEEKTSGVHGALTRLALHLNVDFL